LRTSRGPTRFGTPAAQLKQFIDQAGGLWQEGKLTDKPVTAFTSAFNRHAGSEATILSLGNVFYHWEALIVLPGFTDPVVSAAGGNPYGLRLRGNRDRPTRQDRGRTTELPGLLTTYPATWIPGARHPHGRRDGIDAEPLRAMPVEQIVRTGTTDGVTISGPTSLSSCSVVPQPG